MEDLTFGQNLLSITFDGEEIMIEVCRLADEIIVYNIRKESFLKYDKLNSKLSELYADSGI